MIVCSCSYAFWISTSISNSGCTSVTLISRSQISTEIASRIPIWIATSTSVETSTGNGMEIVIEKMNVTEILISIPVDVVLFRVVLLEILTCKFKNNHIISFQITFFFLFHMGSFAQ